MWFGWVMTTFPWWNLPQLIFFKLEKMHCFHDFHQPNRLFLPKKWFCSFNTASIFSTYFVKLTKLESSRLHLHAIYSSIMLYIHHMHHMSQNEGLHPFPHHFSIPLHFDPHVKLARWSRRPHMRKGLLLPRLVLKFLWAWPLSSCKVRLSGNETQPNATKTRGFPVTFLLRWTWTKKNTSLHFPF